MYFVIVGKKKFMYKIVSRRRLKMKEIVIFLKRSRIVDLIRRIVKSFVEKLVGGVVEYVK